MLSTLLSRCSQSIDFYTPRKQFQCVAISIVVSKPASEPKDARFEEPLKACMDGRYVFPDVLLDILHSTLLTTARSYRRDTTSANNAVNYHLIRMFPKVSGPRKRRRSPGLEGFLLFQFKQDLDFVAYTGVSGIGSGVGINRLPRDMDASLQCMIM